MDSKNVSRLLEFCRIVEERHSRLSFTQLRVLLTLCDVGDVGISMTNLAKMIGVTPSAVSRQVDTLGWRGRIDDDTLTRDPRKSCGLVRCFECPEDYKAVRVALTENGKAYMDSLEDLIWRRERVRA